MIASSGESLSTVPEFAQYDDDDERLLSFLRILCTVLAGTHFHSLSIAEAIKQD